MTGINQSNRRAFIKKGVTVAGTATVGATLLGSGLAQAQGTSAGLTKGDVVILRFLAAAEIIESDLWQQYNELGGIPDHEVPGGTVIAPYPSRSGGSRTSCSSPSTRPGGPAIAVEPATRTWATGSRPRFRACSKESSRPFPATTFFLSRKLPPVSIFRPTATQNAAHGAEKALTDDGLFIGRKADFFAALEELAEAADQARRG